jgi:hypothetical protein
LNVSHFKRFEATRLKIFSFEITFPAEFHNNLPTVSNVIGDKQADGQHGEVSFSVLGK